MLWPWLPYTLVISCLLRTAGHSGSDVIQSTSCRDHAIETASCSISVCTLTKSTVNLHVFVILSVHVLSPAASIPIASTGFLS